MTSEVKIRQFAERFGIREMYVFGSRAEEIASRVRGQRVIPGLPTSDVDIGVIPERGRVLGIAEKVQLAIALEDLLEVSRVDLLVIPEVDIFLAAEIIRGELLYCRDLDEQAETELHILAKAGDLAYFERERIEGILAGGSG